MLSAILPVADLSIHGKCKAVHCLGSNQQLTFKWAQANDGPKVSEPLPTEVMASCYAMTTRSQVREPTPSVVPASEQQSVAHSQESAEHSQQPELDQTSTSSQPEISSLSNFQQRCADAYAKNPGFTDASYPSRYTERHGLWWSDDKLVIPDADALRQHVMCEMHDSPWHGHTGVKKTRKALERYYTWPSLIKDVERYVHSCSSCQRNKSTNQKPAGLLQPLPVPTRKWGSVSMDLITSLPETADGHSAIVVFVCRLTKMVHLVPCKTSIGAAAFAKMFRREVLRLHGNPYEFVSDRDGRFTSRFMREVTRMLNIQQAMSTAYHPQTDGQTERANRVLEDMLRHYVSPTHCDWDEHLDMAEFAINNAWQESVQETPFMLNSGQHPLDVMSLQTHSQVPAASDFVKDMQFGLKHAMECLEHAQQRQKAYADKGRRDVEQYKIGENLLLSTKNVRWRSLAVLN